MHIINRLKYLNKKAAVADCLMGTVTIDFSMNLQRQPIFLMSSK